MQSFHFLMRGGDSELLNYLKPMIPKKCEHFVYSF